MLIPTSMLIMFPIGLAFIAWGSYIFFRNKRLVKKGISVQGFVLENLDEFSAGLRVKPSQMHIRFKTLEGKPVTFLSGKGSFLGNVVPILYNPANPTHAMINKNSELWFDSIVLMSCGVFFLITAVLIK